MSRLALGCVIAILGCSASGPPLTPATLGNLEFSVPAGWKSHDLSDRNAKRVEWTPPDTADRESLVVMHSSPRTVHARAGLPYLEKLLARALAGLPSGAFTRPTRFETKGGLLGVRVEGHFVPPGKSEPYRRTHAVLLDFEQGTFIHVLYTARTPDPDTFDAVVDSLSKRGA